MALKGTGDKLGDAMRQAAHSIGKNDPDAMWKAIGNAIIDHFLTYGSVKVASVTFVSSGTDTSGPGTGSLE